MIYNEIRKRIQSWNWHGAKVMQILPEKNFFLVSFLLLAFKIRFFLILFYYIFLYIFYFHPDLSIFYLNFGQSRSILSYKFFILTRSLWYIFIISGYFHKHTLINMNVSLTYKKVFNSVKKLYFIICDRNNTHSFFFFSRNWWVNLYTQKLYFHQICPS